MASTLHGGLLVQFARSLCISSQLLAVAFGNALMTRARQHCFGRVVVRAC